MEDDQLERAAALAGVATVHLGGPGAGNHLQGRTVPENGGAESAAPERGRQAGERAADPARGNIWRRILFTVHSFKTFDKI
ncbi:MAG: hypothetical protein GC151_01170 [Betaproteobacteria bacterium]|nr:hypothetical protein [Betaproteobacteria bacterium]